MVDEITQAVLSRQDIARYLQDSHRGDGARERVHAYLEELRTTQRYSIYRALKHPLYPILRKIERIGENVEIVKAAARAGRLVYASNHKSHTDYLAEPLVLDDNGIRPPIIAAGINLFGGPLGLLHRHVTGAMPVRRNTKDPIYLVTLKAYVAELLRRHDLFFYPEGGRSYSGELKSPKTGLLHAALQADVPRIAIIPTAIAYDLVLEDHVLARQGVKRTQKTFSRELAEMVRYAVGYRSRAFTTFGAPMTIGNRDVHSRSDVLEMARIVRSRRSGPFTTLRPRYDFSTTFEAIESDGATPVCSRSSGTCDSPASARPRTPNGTTSRPPISTRPLVGRVSPAIASISSVCPFPSTPAMPKISPRRTSNETPSTSLGRRALGTTRSRTTMGDGAAASATICCRARESV